MGGGEAVWRARVVDFLRVLPHAARRRGDLDRCVQGTGGSIGCGAAGVERDQGECGAATADACNESGVEDGRSAAQVRG
jgi:hypothetical protein